MFDIKDIEMEDCSYVSLLSVFFFSSKFKYCSSTYLALMTSQEINQVSLSSAQLCL